MEKHISSDLIAFAYEHLRLENKIFLDRSKGNFMFVPYLMKVPFFRSHGISN